VPGHHGWRGAREGSWVAYTHRIPIPTLDVHAVDRYLWLAPILGLDERPPDFSIRLSPQEIRATEVMLEANGLSDAPLAVLVPGTIWETKHWHVEGFARVGRHLLAAGFSVAIAGTSLDRHRGRMIAEACPGARDLCGRTSVAGLVALLQRASICVTNDSGSMHVAVAVGTPVVSVFGPTNPIWIGPYGRPQAVVRADVSCAPCNLRRLRQCPWGHRCMREVTAAMVIERIERIMASSAVPSAIEVGQAVQLDGPGASGCPA
jgi:ADP-heptose:LPS heptosyltransferase